MVKTSKHTIERMTLEISVEQYDIDNGVCLSQARCMHKVAVARKLLSLEVRRDSKTAMGPHTHHVRVDGQFIKFNFRGWRWRAPTPKIAQRTLWRYDEWGKRDRKFGVPCPVKPHSYKIKAERLTKIRATPRARQDQINAARQARVARGLPDKQSKSRTLRERIVGIHLGHANV